MKIRSGFVSNSSSSSFSIFGIRTNWTELRKLFDLKPVKEPGCKHEYDRSIAKFCPDCGKKAWLIEEPGQEEIEEALSKKGWDMQDVDGDATYVGVSPDVKRDENAIACLDRLKEVAIALEDFFHRKVNFYSGEYYC